MNTATRLLTEYGALCQILEPRDLLSLAKASISSAPAILRTRKLTTLDAAMSRDMTVRLGKTRMVMPLAQIDEMLRPRNDNPTFGNVREMYARNCYLARLRLTTPMHAVLDLGANRGMFSLLALVALKSDVAVGVEPIPIYESVYRLLLEANHCGLDRGPRYTKFVSSPSVEQRNPDQNISIQTILREQKIDRFNLVKMDIEGHEKTVFAEPEWLASVDTLAMELHPDSAGDLSVIPQALKHYGFDYVHVDQAGKPVDIQSSMFLYASCTGALAA